MENNLSTLVNYGALGVMCLWFMYQQTTQVKETNKSLEQLTIAINSLQKLVSEFKANDK